MHSFMLPDSIVAGELMFMNTVAKDNKLELYDIYRNRYFVVDFNSDKILETRKLPKVLSGQLWVCRIAPGSYIALNNSDYHKSYMLGNAYFRIFGDSVKCISPSVKYENMPDSNYYLSVALGNPAYLRKDILLLPFVEKWNKTGWRLLAVSLKSDTVISAIGRKKLPEIGINDDNLTYPSALEIFTHWKSDSVVQIGFSYSAIIYEWHIYQNAIIDSFSIQSMNFNEQDFLSSKSYFKSFGEPSTFGSKAAYGPFYVSRDGATLYRSYRDKPSLNCLESYYSWPTGLIIYDLEKMKIIREIPTKRKYYFVLTATDLFITLAPDSNQKYKNKFYIEESTQSMIEREKFICKENPFDLNDAFSEYLDSIGVNNNGTILYLELDSHCPSCWMGIFSSVSNLLKEKSNENITVVFNSQSKINKRILNKFLKESTFYATIDSTSVGQQILPIFESLVLIVLKDDEVKECIPIYSTEFTSIKDSVFKYKLKYDIK